VTAANAIVASLALCWLARTNNELRRASFNAPRAVDASTPIVSSGGAIENNRQSFQFK
jgi:hypothetical protein